MCLNTQIRGIAWFNSILLKNDREKKNTHSIWFVVEARRVLQGQALWPTIRPLIAPTGYTFDWNFLELCPCLAAIFRSGSPLYCLFCRLYFLFFFTIFILCISTNSLYSSFYYFWLTYLYRKYPENSKKIVRRTFIFFIKRLDELFQDKRSKEEDFNLRTTLRKLVIITSISLKRLMQYYT